MQQIVCIGNALIDAFLFIQHASLHCRLNEVEHELCVAYGQKIPLESAEMQLGGNACNVAVGLSRLGHKATLIAEIGTDLFADKIVLDLTREQVDVSKLTQQNGTTSFAVSINFEGERTLFVKHQEREHTFTLDTVQAEWIYLTSLGKKWRHVYESVLQHKETSPASLAFNPGTAQLEDDVPMCRSVIAVSDIVFLNKEEAERIVGKEEQDISVLLAEIHQLGAQLVVLTDGKQGSYAIDAAGKEYHTAIYETPVVERTGAGDAFATGFLSARLYGKDITEAMQWGTASAASVIGEVGSQPGLLDKNTLEQKIKQYNADI